MFDRLESKYIIAAMLALALILALTPKAEKRTYDGEELVGSSDIREAFKAGQ